MTKSKAGSTAENAATASTAWPWSAASVSGGMTAASKTLAAPDVFPQGLLDAGTVLAENRACIV
jgi:hypothetical protein